MVSASQAGSPAGGRALRSPYPLSSQPRRAPGFSRMHAGCSAARIRGVTAPPPWKIKVVEPIALRSAERRAGARSSRRATTPSCCARRTSSSTCSPTAARPRSRRSSAPRWSSATRRTRARAASSGSRRAMQETLRLPARDPDPPGPRRRAPAGEAARAARACSSRRTSTSRPRASTSSSRAASGSTSRSPRRSDPVSMHPFKGNIDLDALEHVLRGGGAGAGRVRARRRPA